MMMATFLHLLSELKISSFVVKKSIPFSKDNTLENSSVSVADKAIFSIHFDH